MSELKDKIKEIRNREGLSQDEMGRRVGYTNRASVNKIEAWKFADGLDEEEEIIDEFREDPPNIYGFGHTRIYADMIDAIKNDREPYVNGEAGKRALELVLAIYKSATEGKPVKLPMGNVSTIDFKGKFSDK